MQLATLLQDLPGMAAPPPPGVEVSAVCSDSRHVAPGSLFVAMAAATPNGPHGASFVALAQKAGAAAVLTDVGAQVADMGIPVVRVPRARAVWSELSERFFGRPSTRLRLMGITGTNGKTTTGHVVEAIAVAAGEKAGFVGTTAVRVAGEEKPATHTTPPAEALSALLAQMADAGVTTCAMEVSSHALEQQRVEALHFAGAIFTNLTQDHLDYHGTLERYLDAKAQLFTRLLPPDGVAVLNADDPSVAALAPRSRGRVVTFSAAGAPADVQARARDDGAGTQVEVEGALGRFVLRTPLVGTYNVANVLGAAVLHICCGTKLNAVIDGVAALHNVPGRLESVPHPGGVLVLVDYAHTPDALARALEAVRPRVAPGGRLWCVFGCGGDRDAGKRPVMGRVVAQSADVAVVTNDNPRSEDPQKIAQAIVDGVRSGGMEVSQQVTGKRGAVVELDRKAAIALAVQNARSGDVVLVAGKGHEREQIIGNQRVAFDDRQVALQAARSVTP